MPYIGRSKEIKNLTFATGHAMMGWSLGPATGKLVSEIIDNKKTSMDISAFNPSRKF
jgi:D-amino-acid dehydrogenase